MKRAEERLAILFPRNVILGNHLGKPDSRYSPLSLFTLLLASSIITHHGSITFVSLRSLNSQPRFPPSDSSVPITRFQRRSSWKTWRSGQTVRRCHFTLFLSLLSKNTVSSCLMCAVNANELERLKKRFMKLDRCHSSPLPSPCCPLSPLP